MQRKENQTISPVVVNRIIIGIILLIVIAQIGFFKTYISHFPKFENTGTNRFNWVIHFHGMMMMAWLFMLLIQPILILNGNIKLHRLLGQLSYVLAPLVVLAFYLIIKNRHDYLLTHKTQQTANAQVLGDFCKMLFFVILYLLAILYKHKPALHMRYMISTAFIFVTPGLNRLLNNYFGFEQPLMPAYFMVSVVVTFIAIADSIRTRRISPFFLTLVYLMVIVMFYELRNTAFCQTIGNAIATIF